MLRSNAGTDEQKVRDMTLFPALDHDSGQQQAQVRTRITQRYTFALLCIAACSIISAFLLFAMMTLTHRDAEIIETAGHQRMWSQRIALLEMELLRFDDVDTRAALISAINQMAAGHAKLTAEPWSPAYATPALRTHYFGPGGRLDALVENYLRLGRSIAASSSERQIRMDVILSRDTALDPLLADLEKAVDLYHARAHADGLAFERMLFVTTLATLVVVIGQAIFIFAPLAQQLSQSARVLIDQVRLVATVLQVIPAGVAVWRSRDHRLLRVNTTFTTMTGLDNESVSTVPPGLATAEGGQDAELFGRDGTWRIGRVTTQQVGDDDAAAYRVTLIEDQTVDRAREAALADALRAAKVASEAKARFVASVSHEIRTPLNGIIGMLDLMALDAMDGVQSQRLRTARGSSEHLLDLLNDILDAASLEAGAFDIRPEAVAIDPLAQHIMAAFEGRATAAGLTLTLRADAGVPAAIQADPRRLRQILSNLIGNALKFTPSGGVTLRIGAADEALRFAIEDTGPGISAADRARLFERFVKLEQTAKAGGTGLGLAISRDLVRAMGGDIGVDSAPGQGTTFWFTLPLPAPVDGPGHTETASLQILVADDNGTNRLVARAMLERLGHAVTEAVNGQDALEMGVTGRFDLILMDWEMPVLDGLDATRQIVAAGQMPKFGIVGLTAHTGANSHAACIDAGMRGVLTKPLRMDDLARKLAEAVAA